MRRRWLKCSRSAGFATGRKLAGDLTDLVAPPYDRVPDDVQAALYARHPHNIVRVTKGKPEAGDDEKKNVYTRAARTLEEWLRDGVLVRDAEPALYVYHQEYTFGGERLTRKGFMALAQLQPEKVHAHEQTLKGPKEDRLKLMRATEANLEHVFMLYQDPKREADAILNAAVAGRAPDMVAEDADKNAHRVWRITDPEVIRGVQAALADKELYIADGHHRFETSVNYMRECTAAGWSPAAPESFDKRLMTLFNVAEPGMSIRPIHRLVHGVAGFDADAILAKAEELFVVVRHPSFDAMDEAVRAGKDRHTFGFYATGVYATLSLRDERVMDRLISGDRSRDYKRLDVSILHARDPRAAARHRRPRARRADEHHVLRDAREGAEGDRIGIGADLLPPQLHRRRGSRARRRPRGEDAAEVDGLLSQAAHGPRGDEDGDPQVDPDLQTK